MDTSTFNNGTLLYKFRVLFVAPFFVYNSSFFFNAASNYISPLGPVYTNDSQLSTSSFFDSVIL